MRDSALQLLVAAVFLGSIDVPRRIPELHRRADWGFRLAPGDSGAVVEVRRLEVDSAAHRAGLRERDRVLAINGERLAGLESAARALRRWRGGDTVRLVVARTGVTTVTVVFELPSLAEERIPGCEIRYGWVETPTGYRVRTVLTRPVNARGRLPVLVFIPWLSCDAVETPSDHPDGWIRLLRGIARAGGWATYRIEKPGVGDSEGPECGSNDLETDLAAFRAALDGLAKLDGVDPERVVIFGGSIGAALAPVLASERRVAGVIAAGGFSRTWFEHMLEFERARLSLQGTAPAEVSAALRGFSDFYALYLNERLTPAQVIARRPDLARLWYDAPDGQFGRPATYFQQVARLEVERAWAALDVPVLILHGEYDWIMSRAEAEHAAELVGAHGSGRAELVILPRTDHNFGVYGSRHDAFDDRGGSFDEAVVGRVVEWLDRVAAPAGAGH
jgi:pimeloyl-ACP methyl ester carboxylesterase